MLLVARKWKGRDVREEKWRGLASHSLLSALKTLSYFLLKTYSIPPSHVTNEKTVAHRG